MYLNTSVEDVSLAVSKFAACVADINAWLSACKLRLNAAKTQMLWLCSSQLVDRVDYHDVLVLGTRVAISDTARDPGVVTGGPCHGRLSLRLQPATPALTSSPIVVRECHQNARPGVRLVSPGLLQLIAVRHQRRDGLLRRLQSVQNAAARLVTGARRCDHITPVLRQLHWLLVRQRVVFKIAGLVHKSLVGAASAYPADDCRLLSDVGCHPLRSNSNTIQYEMLF